MIASELSKQLSAYLDAEKTVIGEENFSGIFCGGIY